MTRTLSPDLPEPLNISGLLRHYGLKPDKSLGQNFLVDESALAKIVAAAEISKEDSVLEIGAGLGSLSRHLARAARELVTIEIDHRLIPPLRTVMAPFKNVRIVEGDILALNPATLIPTPNYLVVANIPYYITSAVIRHLLEAKPQPGQVLLTIQYEVAQRICAQPGKLSLLALSVQVYGKPQLKFRIPSGAFYPAPKVDSAVVRIDIYPDPVIPRPQLKAFFRIIKAGFRQKRKTLRNALSAGLAISKEQAMTALQAAQINPQRRAETLDLAEWKRLVHQLLAYLKN